MFIIIIFIKNINIDIPRNKLVVITGLSGSGKSSLAFDTIYAEGQRRYVESLSAYARQFLSLMEKPDVDYIEGLSPAISIDQKSALNNPRSTVGTITEIYDYLRLLFARTGIPRCPEHKVDLIAKTISQMVDGILDVYFEQKIMLLSPVVQNRKGNHTKMLSEIANQGFLRVRVDGEIMYLDEIENIDNKSFHTIEIVIDRFKVKKDIYSRLSESLETAINLSNGLVRIAPIDKNSKQQEILFSSKFSCPYCGYSLEELEPRLFSFNNPLGSCQNCYGLGVEDIFDEDKIIFDSELSIEEGAIYGCNKSNTYFNQILKLTGKHYGFSVDTPYKKLSEKHKKIILYGSGKEKIDFSKIKWINKKRTFEGVIPRMKRRYQETDVNAVREELSHYIVSKNCTSCNGSRLNQSAMNVFVDNYNIVSIVEMSIEDCYDFFVNLKLSGTRGQISEKILKEIVKRLEFLINIGLKYLNLDRKSNTLSGGEAQRIRLASQIGAGLVGVLYVLDEPSIGLHQRDNSKLIKTLIHLSSIGNTVIVVEHDEEIIRKSDYVIDIGPNAGIYGGEIVAKGTPAELINNYKSLTADYISGRKSIDIPKKRNKTRRWLKIQGVHGNNLNYVDLAIPVGLLTCVTGVSGSGKSTLVNDTLYSIAAREFNNAKIISAPYKSVKGLNHFNKVININQSPIGRTPRSNPTTYTGLFSLIRDLFSQTLEARSRAYKAGRFSFNVRGGRCEACKGGGVIKVEMHFLSDIYVSCDVCNGKRYNNETLQILYKGKNIYEVLEMTVDKALEFFNSIPQIKKKLQTLKDVGLSYINLGQNSVTLSGGEAQRIKLAKELSKSDTGQTLYIMDEPTTGLHFHDIKQLLEAINNLLSRNNTIVIIEHNLDVIKTADWIVDLGPEGGDKGGEIIAFGTPEDVIKIKKSYTGKYLKKILDKN